MSETQTAFKPKVYVLLPHTKPTAAIYQRVNKDQRQRLDKRPNDSAYLKQTFTTQEGKNRTARLKLSCDTIWQDEQIKPEIGIGANEPFTPAERKALEFTNEINVARIPIVDKYLQSVPQYDGWWKANPNGFSEEKPLYTLLDKETESKVSNLESKKRIRAAAKVAEMEDLKELQDLMIRLNGTAFSPPTEVFDCQNALWEYVDDATDDMLNALLKDEKEMNQDEKLTILLSRAMSEGIISFEVMPNQVARKRGESWIPMKEISSSHPLEERKRYFSEYLTSEEGKLLMADLLKDVKDKTKKK